MYVYMQMCACQMYDGDSARGRARQRNLLSRLLSFEGPRGGEVCVCVCVCVCACVRACVRVLIHTYIHTYIYIIGCWGAKCFGNSVEVICFGVGGR
jgi:hypothetical protein